jgi:penicillin-binding protein 2
MVKISSIRRLALVSGLAALTAAAQNPPNRGVVLNSNPAIPVAPEAPTARGASDGAIMTRKDARTITLKIPAPRGEIVDREGLPLAQNQVAYQVGLQFKQFENADKDFVVNWARTRLDTLQPLVKNQFMLTDGELYDHYQNRRWLPLLVTGQISTKEARALESKLTSGLILQAVYRRYYPEDDLAAHIIGYSGSVGKLPTGPINFNEPMWEETEGRSGLEKIFNDQLTGEPGMKRLLFDEDGNKLLEEQVKRPRPGGTLVTTLDLKWQKLAEKTLKNGCRRGAFVVLDVITGEVLVMASQPSFDLNLFTPGIGEKDFKALNEDPSTPLYGRAFQSVYPPASSFKPVVALAALNNGTVTATSEIYCPASIAIGNTTMRNWSKIPEGSINVKRALARSCNTWFYQIGIKSGPSSFLNLARHIGFGKLTGLPLLGENAGLVPNDEWMMKHEKRRILNGDTANLSIGQGSLLASPLQVAQAMAAIGNGMIVPKLQLIRQVQDTRGRVVKAGVPERKDWLGVEKEWVEVVHKGMSDVVNGGGGTGRSASLSYTTLCGKTGTAQWGPPSKNQRLAWFAGYLPEDNPRYSFAVLYEGRPGETVSGGRMAAPMVKKFFEGIKDDIKDIIAPPKKALVVIEESAEAPTAVAGEGSEALSDDDVIRSTDPSVRPLRALPVEILESARRVEDIRDPLEEPPPVEEEEADAPQRAMRAIPVDEGEIIEDPAGEPIEEP